jgi:membrane fusion protein (multidrug efflux system)
MSNAENPVVPHGTSPAPEPLPRSRLLWPIVVVVVVAVVLVGSIFGYRIYSGMQMGKRMGAMALAPQTVSTAVALVSQWQAQSRAVGSVRALRGADLASQAAGVVDRIPFESGSDVAAGDVLLRLRLNDDAAKLEQLQASATLADQTFRRDKEQFAAQAISQATLDSDAATLKSAIAQVAAQQALIDEKVVRAPFSGRLGIRQVDEGQYLAAGTTIVTLQSLDPLVIDFYVPQQMLATLKTGAPVAASIDAYPGAKFSGTVTSVNSKVDIASRNVQVRATFHNADHRLIPGMYATVEIDAGPAQSLVTIPQAAVTYNPYGDTVFVVDTVKGVANQRFVVLGTTRGDQVAVTKGLAAGETIVSGGQMKLHNGSPVKVDNHVVPTDAAAPSPPNE